jgi:tetratricopeptide (TPR) repeat protein
MHCCSICVYVQFAEASRLKEDGTLLFKEKRFEEAAARYEEATTYIEKAATADADDDDDLTSSDTSSSSSNTVATPAAINALLLSCHLNAAQAYLNAHDWLSAAAAANKALVVDANNVKGLYRRAVARYVHITTLSIMINIVLHTNSQCVILACAAKVH